MPANTEHELFARLGPVCKRRETAVLLEAVGRAMLGGLAVAGVVVLLWGSAAVCAWAGLPGVPRSVPLIVVIAALALAPLVGVWLGLRRQRDWHAAAVAVDRHYRLDDRTVTALEFLARPERKPLEQRQIAQCMEHLERLDANAVVPLALSRFALITVIFVVLGGIAIALPLAVGPMAGSPVESEPERSPPIAPSGEKAIPDTVGADASVAESVDWQVAPSGEVKVTRAALTAGLTLEQIVADAGPSPKPGQTEGETPDRDAQAEATPQTVLGSEPVPLRHRRTVRYYFESILILSN
jgi:hypothetical protein